jgi:fermentation-respiration switch protein FrsA (DUF1100 family)
VRRPRRPLRTLGLLLLAVILITLASWLAGGRRTVYGDLESAAVTPDSSPSGRYRLEHVILTTTAGRSIRCLLRTPTVADRARREATLLVAGGQGTGARAVLLLDSLFAGTAIACDYPWAPLLRARGATLVWQLPRLRAELVATPEFLGIVADFLASHPEADTARLVGLGASLGVPPVAAWAAGDGRVRAVAMVYGGADLGRVLEATFARDIPAWVPSRPLGWLAGRALRPVEPGRTVGGIAPRPLLLIAGADDAWIPRASTEALYAAAGAPKRLVWFTTGHMRPSNDVLLQMLADSVREWMGEVLSAGGAPSVGRAQLR